MQKLHLKDFKDGWILGNFKPSLWEQSNIEVGVITHKAFEERPSHYHPKSREINVLLEGRMLLNGQYLLPNDVFIFEPEEVAYAPTFFTKVKILCIKTPSIPGDKVIL